MLLSTRDNAVPLVDVRSLVEAGQKEVYIVVTLAAILVYDSREYTFQNLQHSLLSLCQSVRLTKRYVKKHL